MRSPERGGSESMVDYQSCLPGGPRPDEQLLGRLAGSIERPDDASKSESKLEGSAQVVRYLDIFYDVDREIKKPFSLGNPRFELGKLFGEIE